MAREEYDWIDDAFDEGKQDPLARKGMTGCSGAAVVVVVVALVVVVLLVGAAMAGMAAFAGAAR